jgi:hypothetical protein
MFYAVFYWLVSDHGGGGHTNDDTILNLTGAAEYEMCNLLRPRIQGLRSFTGVRLQFCASLHPEPNEGPKLDLVATTANTRRLFSLG